MEEGTWCGRGGGGGNTASLWVFQYSSVPLVQLRRDGRGREDGQMDVGTKRDIYCENITSSYSGDGHLDYWSL